MSGSEIEVWTGGVQTWECDYQGHMNVRFYVAKSMEAMESLVAELGLEHAFSPGAAATVVVREQYVRFLRETHAGAWLYVTGSVAEIGESTARLLLVMRHPGGEPAASFQTVVEHVAADDGAPLPWPAPVPARADELRSPVPPFAAARTLALDPVSSQASRERAESLGLVRTALTVISNRDCDVFGRMRHETFIARIGDGIPRLFGRQAPELRDADGRRAGGAALEYRLIHLRRPRAGDRLEIRSAIAEMTPRWRRTVHWMLDPRSGRPWGVAENVGVSFDLETRKVSTMTPEQLEAARGQVVEGLTL